MLKKRVLPGIFAALFLSFSLLFWYVVKRFYVEPFGWISFTKNFDANLIFLGLTLIGLILCSALLTITKPKTNLTKGVYFAASMLQWLFIPFGPFLILSMFVFFFGFMLFENVTFKTFHTYIRINFWDTYTRTIPGLISTMSLVIAITVFQSSINNVNNVSISIPDGIIEQTINFMSLPAVKGESTSNRELAQVNTATFDQLVNEQMQRFGITDPQQQQLIREQVKQMYGVETTPSASAPASALNRRENLTEILEVPPAGNALLNEVQNDYRTMVVSQTKQEVEKQLDRAIVRYRSYLPILNTLAVFFLLGIIALPVIVISVPLVTGIMLLLRKINFISVVKVKEEVERIEW